MYKAIGAARADPRPASLVPLPRIHKHAYSAPAHFCDYHDERHHDDPQAAQDQVRIGQTVRARTRSTPSPHMLSGFCSGRLYKEHRLYQKEEEELKRKLDKHIADDADNWSIGNTVCTSPLRARAPSSFPSHPLASPSRVSR